MVKGVKKTNAPGLLEADPLIWLAGQWSPDQAIRVANLVVLEVGQAVD